LCRVPHGVSVARCERPVGTCYPKLSPVGVRHERLGVYAHESFSSGGGPPGLSGSGHLTPAPRPGPPRHPHSMDMNKGMVTGPKRSQLFEATPTNPRAPRCCRASAPKAPPRRRSANAPMTRRAATSYAAPCDRKARRKKPAAPRAPAFAASTLLTSKCNLSA
jgi:hypothetical protein